jgi:hypothetical protein
MPVIMCMLSQDRSPLSHGGAGADADTLHCSKYWSV